MARVNSITHKHKNDVGQINCEIIQQWIAGRGKHPVTWETLTEVLRDLELTTLAGEIEAVKCLHNSEQGVAVVIPDGGFEPDKLRQNSVEQTVVANVLTGDVETLKRRDTDIPANNIIDGESLGNGSARPQGTDPKLEQKFSAADVETVTEDSEVCEESAKKVSVTEYGVLKCEGSEQEATAEMSSGSCGVGGTEKTL